MRLKAFIAIAIVIVVSTAALCAALWRLSTDSFESVEEDLVVRDAERAHGVVEADLASLSNTALDWAQWDDTYAFTDRSDAPADPDDPEAGTVGDRYIESNLAPSTFKQNGLSALAVTSTTGTALYAGTYAAASNSVDAGIDPALAAFATERAGMVAGGGPEPFGGVLVGGGGASWEAVSVPILRSDGSGPPAGVLVMARALDAAALGRFGDTLRLSLSLAPLGSAGLTQGVLARLDTKPPAFAASVGDDRASDGYATLATLNGPPLVLTFTEAPVVATLNDSQQVRLAAILVVMGAVIALVMIVIADRYVLSRLVTMSRTVDRIAESGDVSVRIPDLGHDEIGRLASGTNTMLTRIEGATDALESARVDAEAGSRAKSEFLANMSHELRTPLHAVLGMTRLASETDARPERNELLATVEDAATALLDMVDDILVLAQEEAGTLELNPAPFSPAALAGELATAAAAVARPGVEVHAVVPEEVAAAVVGDLGRIRHCVGNLVGNAAKFTSRGTIVISVDQYPADTDAVEGSAVETLLRFVVSDTGDGIPPERLEDVLAAFAQADSSSTRRHGGTGLGVTVAARLARRMGGELRLESEPGVGTTASVTVPVCAAPVPVAAATTAAVPEPHRDLGGPPPSASVLVVEDNLVNQRVARRMLEKLGHQVHVVEDGAQAVAAVAAGDVDVVLMDVQMPVMDGLEAARRIRIAEEGTATHVPIVALTAHAMAGDRERCMDAGMDAYVAKPFNAETLVTALTAVLGGTQLA